MRKGSPMMKKIRARSMPSTKKIRRLPLPLVVRKTLQLKEKKRKTTMMMSSIERRSSRGPPASHQAVRQAASQPTIKKVDDLL